MNDEQKKEIIEFLKEHLTIHAEYSNCVCNGERLKLQIKIDSEVIDSTTTDLY